MSKVVIIGGCGRVGLRTALHAANKGHEVTCIDFDEERINELNQRVLPFIEEGAEIYLETALKSKRLKFSTEYREVKNAEIVIIAVGTPADSNLNPSLEPIVGILFDISEYIKQKQLIIFRSTIAPDTTGRIKYLLEDRTNLKTGKNIYLAFAPEILTEKNKIHDLSSMPQPIGVYDDESFRQAKSFFQTITNNKIVQLTSEEALLAKLMNNTISYIQSACANEFYLISQTYNANYHKIADSIGKTLDVRPDPNACSPGTHKEGWFLTNRLPFLELITTSFKINESMPQYIAQILDKYKVNKIVILGMTNKQDSDDTNSSLSYKLRKILVNKNYAVYSYDPYLPEYSDSFVLNKADAVILMTPHKKFQDLNKIKKQINNSQCLFVDLFGFWEETRQKGFNGILQEINLKVKKGK